MKLTILKGDSRQAVLGQRAFASVKSIESNASVAAFAVKLRGQRLFQQLLDL